MQRIITLSRVYSVLTVIFVGAVKVSHITSLAETFYNATNFGTFEARSDEPCSSMVTFDVVAIARTKHQVFNSIVRCVSVPVVDHFCGQQNPPKVLFHYKAMFQHVECVSWKIRMAWASHENISGAFSGKFSTLPIRISLKFSGKHKQGSSAYSYQKRPCLSTV